MQDLTIGGYTVPVQFETYSSGLMALDTVNMSLSGDLDVSSGQMPRQWIGSMIISPEVPGHPTFEQLETLWNTKGPISLVDHDATVHSVIIESRFSVRWDDPMAKYGILDFIFTEVLT